MCLCDCTALLDAGNIRGRAASFFARAVEDKGGRARVCAPEVLDLPGQCVVHRPSDVGCEPCFPDPDPVCCSPNPASSSDRLVIIPVRIERIIAIEKEVPQADAGRF
jgi:hypothetical protein